MLQVWGRGVVLFCFVFCCCCFLLLTRCFMGEFLWDENIGTKKHQFFTPLLLFASPSPHPNPLLHWCSNPGRCQHMLLPRDSLEVQTGIWLHGLESHSKPLFHSFSEPWYIPRKMPVTGELEKKAKKCPTLFSLPWLPFPASCHVSMRRGAPGCVLARDCLWSLTAFSSHSQIWPSLSPFIY